MKFPNIPSTSVKLMLFPFSLEGAARIWLEKEPPRSILTWDDLVSKFINQFLPPSKTTNLRNEITRFQQRFDESFYEAWDRFNDLLRACPHHGFLELHQLDTFYNALNSNDQDSLNSAAGGNFLDKMPRECLKIIESKSKVRQSRSKAIVAKVSMSSSTPGVSPDVAELKDMVKALLLDKKNQSQAPATVKAVEESCVTCGGAHSHRNCPATDGNVYRDNIQEYVSQAATVNYNQGNTGYRPLMVANQVRPPGFPPVQQNQGNNQNRYNQNRGNNYNQGPIFRPPVNQPPAYQAPSYQAPAPQAHGVSKADFESYVKANDAVMQNMQSQMTNKRELPHQIVIVNKLYFGLGFSSRNTIVPPKGDVKAITTRSGVSYNGPQVPPPISSLSKEMENKPEDLELKDLPSHLKYAFLEGDDKLPVIIAKNLNDEDKAALIKVLKSHKHAIAWKISDINGIESIVLHPLDFDGGKCQTVVNTEKVPRCEDTNLVLNWEKCHFMVKEGIVLGHKISKIGIEVDKMKVNVIAKFPHPSERKELSQNSGQFQGDMVSPLEALLWKGRTTIGSPGSPDFPHGPMNSGGSSIDVPDF
ncbi:reverse transcriptase domain-containing protein [Tanacetum coccineum]